MSKKLSLLILILFICLIDKSFSFPFLKERIIRLLQERDDDNYNPEKFNSSNSLILFNLYDQFNKYFEVNNSDINTKDCRDFIFNDLILDYHYTNLYFYSGHKLTDIGYPADCLDNNFTYLLPLLTFDIDENMVKEDDKMSYFASKNKYCIGFCIWNQCNNFVEENLVKNLDNKFKTSMEKIYNIKDIKITWKHNEMNYEFSLGIRVFKIIIYIYISLYIFIKLIIWSYTKYKESLQNEKRKKKDYLKMYENSVIREEENEDEDSINEISDIKEEVRKRNMQNKTEEDSNEEEKEEEEEKENEEEEEEEDEEKISKDALFKKNVEESKIRYIERNLKKMNNNSINRSGYDADEINNNKKEKKINLLNNNLDEKRGKYSGCISLINKFNDSFLKFVSIKSMIEYENKIYSNKGLEMITGLRVIFIIMITFNLIFNSFVQGPSIKLINNPFLSSVLFLFIKLSSYGIYLWIFLDGFIYVFKLMHFVNKDRSFLNFLKFGSNLISKIFCFLIIFYFIYFMQKDIGKAFAPSSILFEQYTENELNYKCLNNPVYLLFPFINSITTDNKMIGNYFNNCYQFSYLLINELYCIIITILIFYFLYRYKSKIIEMIICIILIVNIVGLNFLPYFFENVKDEKYYLLKYILGETFSIRYPHSMYNIFFIGLFCGLIYYYHYYSLNDFNSFLSEEYLPFSFLSKIMQYLLKCNIIIKIILIVISSGLILLDSLLYFIIKSSADNDQFLFTFNTSLKILYLYETPIIILLFSILLLFLLFAEDKFQIKSFLGSKIFYTTEKISFSYICLIEMVNILFISSSNNHGDVWSFISFLYITCFEFTVCFLFSFLSTLFFELPIKILVNNIRGKKMY